MPVRIARAAQWGILLLLLSWPAAAATEITVYKSATCGCCSLWVDHVKTNGFAVTVHTVADMNEYKEKHGVPPALQSCHTGLVEGYVIEGHVPAADIHRLLKEKPPGKGLAVPGMPMGAPGMDMGGSRQAYDVLLFDENGKTTIFQRYEAK